MIELKIAASNAFAIIPYKRPSPEAQLQHSPFFNDVDKKHSSTLQCPIKFAFKPRVLFVMAMVFGASLVRANEQSEACHSLIAQSNSSDTNLLCAGLLPSGLLLITKDFYVYQIAHGAMDSAETLYLGSSPELIKDKVNSMHFIKGNYPSE